MTISAASPFEIYTIVDDNAPLDFPYPFEFTDEIEVRQNGVLLNYGTHYTVTGMGAPAGGQINPVAALVGSQWTAQRLTRLQQGSVTSDPIAGLALDRLTKMAQDVRVDADRAVKFHFEDETASNELPPLVAGKAIIVNDTADGLILGDVAAGIEETVAELQNDLNQEIADRIAAIAAETAARIAQDNVLMALITGGGSSPAAVRAYLSLDQVNNTTDANKPISTAVATALAGKLATSGVAADSAKLNNQLPAFYLALANMTGTLLDANLHQRLQFFSTQPAAGNDANQALGSGTYHITNAGTNIPTADWYFIRVIDFNTGSRQIVQEAVALFGTAADTKTYRRHNNSGVWGAWYKCVTSQAEADAQYAQWFIQAGDPGAVGAGAIWVTS